MKYLIILLLLLLLTGCSTFESFSFRLPLEIAYGDTAVSADGAAEIAKINADSQVMQMAAASHTVDVNLPPEMMPAIEVYPVPNIADAPDALVPGASGMATMNDGTTLHDCVRTKGGLIECQVLDE